MYGSVVPGQPTTPIPAPRSESDQARIGAGPLASMGVELRAGGAYFGVFAEASAMTLRLTHPGTGEARAIPMSPALTASGVWKAEVPGDWRGWSYSYDLVRDGKTTSGIIDPWARLVRGGRAFIVEEKTRVSPRPPMAVEDAVIYELHLRDFTRDPACGVKPEWRGKYLGLSQGGTKLEGTTLSTGLDHIVELGATVVQIMPVHAFAMPYNPEYEWGYMPTDFQAPHPGYASGEELAAPITELKRLVSALHERGLRVTLDVVFNHTYELWPDRLHSFMALAPREYYRFKDDGTPWNGALCGNEFRSESVQGRRFIIESCLYWVREFGVDGFRFDLMGLIDRETIDLVVRELHAIDPTILVYGEPWAAGPTPVVGVLDGAQRGKGFAVFSDEFRDTLRGNVFDLANLGFLERGQNIAQVKQCILGGVTSFTDSPLESINYIECHDNHTLLDRIEVGCRHFSPGPDGKSGLGAEEKLKMSALGALALMTSQGIPFLHSGQELGRTKDGHENSYNLGDQINNIKWSEKSRQLKLFGFYRDAVAMRRAHPMFRLKTKDDVLRAVEFLDDRLQLNVPRGCVAFRVTDVTGRDSWKEAVVVMNGTAETTWAALPPGEWRVMAFEGAKRLGAHGRAKDWLEVPGHLGAVLYRERVESEAVQG